MLLINKILVVLNLLGAFVFMVLFSTDNLRRAEWNRATEVARQVNYGLTLNETDKDQDDRLLVARNDDKVQKALRLDKVKTQTAAVKELKQKIDGRLDAVKGDPRKYLAENARFLLPLADSYGARDRLVTLRSYQAPDMVNKRLVDQLDQALTTTLKKLGAAESDEKAGEAFAREFRDAMQLAGPGEGKGRLGEAFVRALTEKAGGQAGLGKAALAAAKGGGADQGGGEDAVAVFLRAVYTADTAQSKAALLEATYFEAANLLLQAQLAAAIRPALDSLRNVDFVPGDPDKAFFTFKVKREVEERKPNNEDQLEKSAREQRENMAVWARKVLADHPNLPDADLQRIVAFRGAYLSAVAAQPGEPRGPYAAALVDLLTADPSKVQLAFDAAEKAWPPGGRQGAGEGVGSHGDRFREETPRFRGCRGQTGRNRRSLARAQGERSHRSTG